MTIFHRRPKWKKQALRDAIKINRSRQLWGQGAFGGLEAALAWQGPLPATYEGTEFTTDIPYAINGDPSWAYWYLPEHGGDAAIQKKFEGGETFACIDIEPLLNRYRCK